MEKDFTKYNSVELAQDASFIRWIKKKDSTSVKFWEQWLQDHPDKKDIVDEARRMVLAIQFKEPQIKQIQIDNLLDEN